MKKYNYAEVAEAINAFIRSRGAMGASPAGIKKMVDQRWGGWETPSIRTIERHLVAHPCIRRKQSTGSVKMRSHVKHDPFVWGHYVWTEGVDDAQAPSSADQG